MDINEVYDRINKKRQLTEAERINIDIFKQSTMAKYYNFGLAQGLAYACIIASELDEPGIKQWAAAIRESYKDQTFLEYFDRLIDEYQ